MGTTENSPLPLSDLIQALWYQGQIRRRQAMLLVNTNRTRVGTPTTLIPEPRTRPGYQLACPPPFSAEPPSHPSHKVK